MLHVAMKFCLEHALRRKQNDDGEDEGADWTRELEASVAKMVAADPDGKPREQDADALQHIAKYVDVCNMQHAIYDTQHASCTMQQATCDLHQVAKCVDVRGAHAAAL